MFHLKLNIDYSIEYWIQTITKSMTFNTNTCKSYNDFFVSVRHPVKMLCISTNCCYFTHYSVLYLTVGDILCSIYIQMIIEIQNLWMHSIFAHLHLGSPVLSYLYNWELPMLRCRYHSTNIREGCVRIHNNCS